MKAHAHAARKNRHTQPKKRKEKKKKRSKGAKKRKAGARAACRNPPVDANFDAHDAGGGRRRGGR